MLRAQALHSTLMMIPPGWYKVIEIGILEMQALLTFRALEVHRHQRTQVALGVLVGIEVAGEAPDWQVVDSTNVLLVGWVLALARYPNGV